MNDKDLKFNYDCLRLFVEFITKEELKKMAGMTITKQELVNRIKTRLLSDSQLLIETAITELLKKETPG